MLFLKPMLYLFLFGLLDTVVTASMFKYLHQYDSILFQGTNVRTTTSLTITSCQGLCLKSKKPCAGYTWTFGPHGDTKGTCQLHASIKNATYSVTAKSGIIQQTTERKGYPLLYNRGNPSCEVKGLTLGATESHATLQTCEEICRHEDECVGLVFFRATKRCVYTSTISGCDKASQVSSFTYPSKTTLLKT